MGKAVQDFNLGYFIGRPLVEFGARCHYNRMVLRGTRKLPKGEGYLMAPCHQQALMEPLAVLNAVHRPPVFLARADIFAQPTIRAILSFLKIMPVYRIRDGKQNLSKNTEIFDKSRQVILDRHPLCLMAEGKHNNRHQLLPLVKGMFRIAGETQHSLGNTPLYIYPTGIDFEDYERPYHNICLEVGEPIAIQPFMETFTTNEPLALNQMRNTLAPAMKGLMHHIESTQYYDEALALSHLLNPSYRKRNHLCNNAWNRFQMRKQIARRFDELEANQPAKLEPIASLTRQYLSKTKALKVSTHQHAECWNPLLTLFVTLLLLGHIAALVLCAPFRWTFLFLLACYPISLLPTHLLMPKLIKDTQFRSSVNFVIRLLLSIIYVLVFSIILGCNHGGFWGTKIPQLSGLAWWAIAIVAPFFLAWINGFVQHLLQRYSDSLIMTLKGIFHHKQVKELHNLKQQLEDMM